MPTSRLLRLSPMLLLLALATACSSSPPPATLAPSPADTNPGARILRPGDVVKVQVFGHDDLSGEFPVDENTNLLLPIVGEFSIKDMTVTELRARIRREYGQLYTQSFVSVVPMFRVAVLGEVMHPGLYSVDPTMTLYEVLALAGGSTRNAKDNDVRVIRGTQQARIQISASAIAGSTIREIGVRSGDQVYVPRKAITYETWLVGLQLLNLALLAYSIFR